MLIQAFYLKSKFVGICYFLNGALRSLKSATTLLIINISRRGDRVAEGAALEMLCAGNPRTAGSNPALSAKEL